MEKNKVMMIVIIILLVTLLATIIGLGVFTISSIKKGKDNEGVSQAQEVEQIAALKKDDITLIKLAEPINTNLAVGTDGKDTHAMRVNITLAVNNKMKKDSDAIMKTLTDKEVIVRDVILAVVKRKTFEEMKRPDGAEILKEEILQSLKDEFDSNLIVAIYVSDVYYQ